MSIPSVTEVTTQQAILENRNILIVDDEEPIRRLLGYLLEPHGYKVALAGEAREARQRMESGSYASVSYTHLDVYKRQSQHRACHPISTFGTHVNSLLRGSGGLHK